MSVLKKNRRPSQFEVFHHFYKMRKEITEFLLRDFGYDNQKALQKIEASFGNRKYEDLTDNEKVKFKSKFEKNKAIDDWFIEESRKTILDCIRSVNKHIFVANSIYPTCQEELTERRIQQDYAIGQCFVLTQELQYIIETLPVDVNKYLRFADMIQTEINLIKGWRKADNKLKGNF